MNHEQTKDYVKDCLKDYLVNNHYKKLIDDSSNHVRYASASYDNQVSINTVVSKGINEVVNFDLIDITLTNEEKLEAVTKFIHYFSKKKSSNSYSDCLRIPFQRWGFHIYIDIRFIYTPI